jgi:hypothetical protein
MLPLGERTCKARSRTDLLVSLFALILVRLFALVSFPDESSCSYLSLRTVVDRS